MLVEGTTIFNTCLTHHDEYQGQSTGKFTIQVKLESKVAAKLAKDGVIIKEYEGEPVRKFSSRYDVPVYTGANELWKQELPSGSKVRIEYITKKHPQHGQIPYLKRVLVLEMGEGMEGAGDKDFFSDEQEF
jgi:hypothetical protein